MEEENFIVDSDGGLNVIDEISILIVSNNDVQYIELDCDKFRKENSIEEIHIMKCPNLKRLTIANANLEILKIRSQNFPYNIVIENSNIKRIDFKEINVDLISISNTNISISLVIKDSIIENFEINPIKSEKTSNFGNVSINNSTIKYLNFYTSSFEVLNINSTELYNFYLDDVDIGRFRLDEITNNSDSDCELNFSNNVIVHKDFFLRTAKESNNFYILILSLLLKSKSDIILGNNWNTIRINELKCPNGIHITAYKTNTRNELSLQYSTACEGLITIDSVNFEILNLSGTNLKMTTYFIDSKISLLTFNKLYNQSFIQFINCKVEHKFESLNSDLNNILFNPLELAKEINLSLKNTNFSNSKFLGTGLINLDNIGLEEKEKEEYYRQFKIASKNSQNRFLELEYKSKEISNYKTKNCFDKILLWVNSLSNHGLNWFRPLIVTLVLNIFFCIIFTPNLYTNYFGSFDLGYTFSTLLLIWDKFTFCFFLLLNPIARLSEYDNFIIYPKELNKIAISIFFISKFINGIMYYQIISAFRKFIPKQN